MSYLKVSVEFLVTEDRLDGFFNALEDPQDSRHSAAGHCFVDHKETESASGSFLHAYVNPFL